MVTSRSVPPPSACASLAARSTEASVVETGRRYRIWVLYCRRRVDGERQASLLTLNRCCGFVEMGQRVTEVALAQQAVTCDHNSSIWYATCYGIILTGRLRYAKCRRGAGRDAAEETLCLLAKRRTDAEARADACKAGSEGAGLLRGSGVCGDYGTEPGRQCPRLLDHRRRCHPVVSDSPGPGHDHDGPPGPILRHGVR